mmetsp:Transcript_11808/g.21507  ORF Transcript_11808/g.21507 Transcript_11808/m.21507 type:complete len:496 (-) Transcript_11808:189-1676(-)
MAVAEECNPEGKSSPEMTPAGNVMSISWSLKNTFIEAGVPEAPPVPGLKRSRTAPARTPPRGPEQHEAFEVSPEQVEEPKGACSELLHFELPKARTDVDGGEQVHIDSEPPAVQCEEQTLVETVSRSEMAHSVDDHSVGKPMPEAGLYSGHEFIPAQQHMFAAGMQLPANTTPYQGDNWTYPAPSPVMAAGATAACQEFPHFTGAWPTTPTQPVDPAAWNLSANGMMWNHFGGAGYVPLDKPEAEMVAMPGAEGSMHGWWSPPPVQMWIPSQGQQWQPVMQMPVNAQVAMTAMGQHPYYAQNGQPWGVPAPPVEPVPESTCTGFMSHNDQTLRGRRAYYLNRAQGALWIVDAKKLTQNYKQAVSPEFRITFGSGPSKKEVVFKLIIYPRTHADGGKKGNGSFKKTRGRGVVQLKCDTVLTDAAGAEVTFSIGIGSSDETAEHQMRGPVLHNFAQSAVCGLEKSEEEWDFQQAVDNTGTFGVSLEIAMGRAERRVA